jgi:DNA-directed RNA polymerase subunit RPC12/RpoP
MKMSRFRRPMMPPFRGFPPRPRRPLRQRAARIAMDRLRTAHSLLEQGKPQEAAAIFAEIADAAANRDIPRAAAINLQAGRAYIAANDVETGLEQIRHGLEMMASTGQVARLPYIGRRVLAELRERGLVEEAQAIEAEIQSLLSKHGLSLAKDIDTTDEGRLPVKCPYCGGNVQPNEVEWLRHQAVCDYCGSRLT